jgi:lysine 2,3-aminomutase
MTENEKLDRIAISVRSHRLLRVLLRENPMLETIMRESKNEIEAQIGVKNWIHSEYSSRKDAFRFQTDRVTRRENFEKLSWNDYAIIRILDYIEHAGIEYPDPNLRGEIAVSNPIRFIWLAVIKGTGGAKPEFFIDMIQLFRQLRGESMQVVPDRIRLRNGWIITLPELIPG